VLYASDACVQEIRHNSLLIEFNRTRRTIGSGIKTVLYSWSLLTSLHRPEAWFLLGHRVARWISPFALILALAALAVLASISTEASVILAVACAVIVAGGIGAMLEFQNISISILRFPAFFTMMNLAAAWAFVTVLAGGRFDQWRPSPEAGRQK
jgi:sorbitol-specific phosphotransferase system component IIBC